MATTHDVYTNGLLALADGTVDWKNDTNIAAVLLKAAYEPNLGTHSTYSNVSANIVDDAGYVNQAVGTRNVELSGSDVDYTSDDVIYGTDVTIAAQYMVFVKGDPADLQAGDRLISLHDFSETKSSTNSTFRVNMDGRWFRLSVAT
jgi:hypothetical protein